MRPEEHLDGKLDGKYVLSTRDGTLRPEEVALGYKQLMEVEKAFKTLKTTLELRPPYHHKDERIRAKCVSLFPFSAPGAHCRAANRADL